MYDLLYKPGGLYQRNDRDSVSSKGACVKDNAFFYIMYCPGNSNWLQTFFSSAPSLFSFFCKSDSMIYTTLTKIIGIMQALKLTFDRWYK